ncbi:hypothetical protein FPCIR_656 [Fusarium pseudocircinatum]|uniref:Uncharacterized protein n=1 Tax=Fusarium pseudocircinatum TaxID=56676 RepID=A0A8H5V0E4_9HYPO|nr:hypothetical protein FPCIR_656 [Fusarium pseudocircinatum]
MARLSNVLMLLSVAGRFAAAQFDQEKQNKDATCNLIDGAEQIERSSNDCDAHGIPFTFDAEAVCGIKLPASSTVSISVTMSEATTVTKAKASETVTTSEETTPAMTTATGTESSAASQTTSAAASTVTDNSASRAKGMVAAAAVALGVFI